MQQHQLLSSSSIEQIGSAVSATLERIGILCENDELLASLAAYGATVDREAQRAQFPRALVREFVESLRSETATTGGSQPEKKLPALGMQIAQGYHDYPSGRRRPGTREHLISMIKLADTLHPDIPAGHCLVQTEVPPRIEALETALLFGEYAHLPGKAFAWYVDQVDWLREMGAVLGIDDWAGWGAICFGHPLRFDKTVADKFVRRVREGVPTGLTAMPVAGVSTPVTIDGFVTVAAAEHIVTWLAARSINPDVELSGDMWAGTIDPATGTVSYSTFDSMRRAFATAGFLKAWTGRSVAIRSGEYCDAKEPGLAALYEKAHKAMMIASFTGVYPTLGEGLLECGRVLSPVELLIERDFVSGIHGLHDEIEVSAESIGFEMIEEIDLGMTRSHLDTEHTLNRFRSSLWLPELIDRTGWRGAEGDRSMLDRAQDEIDRLLSTYRKPEGREDQLEKMRSIVERAKPHLLE